MKLRPEHEQPTTIMDYEPSGEPIEELAARYNIPLDKLNPFLKKNARFFEGKGPGIVALALASQEWYDYVREMIDSNRRSCDLQEGIIQDILENVVETPVADKPFLLGAVDFCRCNRGLYNRVAAALDEKTGSQI